MAIKPLFDPTESDMFGLKREDYQETLDGFSEDFNKGLATKGRETALNAIELMGKALEDPSVLIDVTGNFFRLAAAFAVKAGYVELTDAGARDVSAPVNEDEAAEEVA